MSASPAKAAIGLLDHTQISTTPTPANPASASASGREALQALLAFSSLQQQIRQRREQDQGNDTPSSSEDVWQVEQFVLDEVLQLVADRALAITGADGVAIALAEGSGIVCRASSGAIAPDAGAQINPNAGFSGACLVSGSVVRCDDSETDSRVNVEACRRLGARSMVAVPLSARNTVAGLLEAFSSEAYGFNDSDVRSLSLLAELILAAMRPEEEDRLAELSQCVVGVRRNGSSAAPEIQEDAAPAASQTIEKLNPEPPPSESTIPIQVVPAALQPDFSAVNPVSPANGGTETSGAKEAAADSSEYVALETTRPGLVVVLAVLLIAIGLGTTVWWSMRQHARPVSANAQPVLSPPAPAPSAQPLPSATPPSIAAPSADGSSAPALDVADAGPQKSEGLSRVAGIRHWSSADSSTVVIDLGDQVQYEAHRLSAPERIYFDLHDTSLAPELSGKNIEIDDALLTRVRAAQSAQGVTRVVLETKSIAEFSVSLEQNPYRLVIEVRKPGAKPTSRTKVDLFGPANENSPGQNQAQESAALSNGKLADGKKLAAQGRSDTVAAAYVPKLRIALDAGHGGWDLGTVGRRGLLEKDLVLDIVERLGKLVGDRLGAEVIYTRTDDEYLALEKRAEIANLSRADLFVSVHANYSDYPSARGVETYYTNTYSSVRARTADADAGTAALQNISWTNVDIRGKVLESRRFAARVQQALYGMLSAKNSSIRNRGVKEAQYAVLTGTTMPAILAEVSFVSSPTDETALQSAAYRQQIAAALYVGIARYAEDSNHVKMASNSAKPSGR